MQTDGLKFLSVCSGIEAASVAWKELGWKPVGFSEIEPFPSALLKHHYPDVLNFGDMTLLPESIRLGFVDLPDVLCGGTPCQAFSVAGLRKSLDDARGNLTLTFCEIANAIDDERDAAGLQPSIIFWENVPGVLNTKDNAFGCFLAALAGETCVLEPAGGRWTNAGCVLGPSRAVAWRTLDAQYFGVAQRRRRVFVVASARDDIDPAAVLFEFDGVRRDFAPSREAREVSARGVAGGTGGGGEGIRPPVCASDFGDLAPTVTSKWMKLSGGPAGSISELGNSVLVDAQPVGFNARQDPDSWVNRTGPLDTDGSTQAVAQAMQVRRLTPVECERLQGFPDGWTAIPWRGKPVAVDIDNCNLTGDCAGNILAGAQMRTNKGMGVMSAMQVRRLTPVECERLQGFPDGYTNIPWRGKPEAPDGPRYKALGNSWAVPVVRWIGRRIGMHLAGAL